MVVSYLDLVGDMAVYVLVHFNRLFPISQQEVLGGVDFIDRLQLHDMWSSIKDIYNDADPQVFFRSHTLPLN